VTVSGAPPRGAVVARARELIGFAQRHGYGRDELVEMIRRLPA
jgi:hypothetical protein